MGHDSFYFSLIWEDVIVFDWCCNTADYNIATYLWCNTPLVKLCLMDHLREHCGSDFPWSSTQPQRRLHTLSARQSYKHMLMTADTCEYFTVRASLLCAHICISRLYASQITSVSVRVGVQSESWWFSMWLFFVDHSLWVISICVRAHRHLHTIPPADCQWRPPGHNQ